MPDPVKQLLNIHQAVTWLEPIQLDPLPENANLTAAILSRISDSSRASARDAQRAASVLDAANELDRARNELSGFQTKSLHALEGNGKDRRPHVDQETYAVNVFENERTRPAIRAKLNGILKRIISKGSGDYLTQEAGLFVIVIDDVDIRPSRAVEALQLANLLSIPRLFFVFSGVIETIDQLLLYRTQNEFLRELGEGSKSEFIRNDIEGRSNEIASSLLRKLVPPSRRISIQSMSASEAWHKPWADERSLRGESALVFGEVEKLLWPTSETDKNAKDAESTMYTRLRDAQTEADLNEAEQALIQIEQKARWWHPGSEEVLVAPPRHLRGLLAEMRSKTDRQNGSDTPYTTLRGRLWDLFKAVVDEDPNLGIPAQRELQGKLAVEGLALGVLSLEGITTKVRTGQRLQTFVCLVKNDVRQLVVSEVSRRVLSVTAKDGARDLGNDACAMFMLIHDYCALGKESRVIGEMSWDNQSRKNVAYTRDESGVEVPWYCMVWPTYRQEQQFFHEWNRGIERMGRILNDRSSIKDNHVAVLLGLFLCWTVIRVSNLKCGLDTFLRGKKAEKKKAEKKKANDVRRLRNDELDVPELLEVTTEPTEQDGRWTCSLQWAEAIEKIVSYRESLGDFLEHKLDEGEEDADFTLGLAVHQQLAWMTDPFVGVLQPAILEVKYGAAARSNAQIERMKNDVTEEAKARLKVGS